MRPGHDQAQLVTLRCPQCGDRQIEGDSDAVFFFCKNCQSVLEPRGGELVTLSCLWEKTGSKPPKDAIYVPFWVFRTEALLDANKRLAPSLSYPADFMVPACISPDMPVAIMRLGHKFTLESGNHQYSNTKEDLEPEPGRYSREDAIEAVELLFLSIERGLFSEAPNARYELKSTYKNLCFLVWERSKLDLVHVPDEKLLMPEALFAQYREEQKIETLISFAYGGLSIKHFRIHL
jgi:ribosomal protein S27E